MTQGKQSAQALVDTVLEGLYRIVGLIGEGGMGAVYEAMHLRLHKRVAVKVMARELAESPEALGRFHREAMVTSALGHPHIVQVFDFSTTPTGEPFLVMEFLEGEDLDKRLRRVRRLSPAGTLHVVKQVASALAATHAKTIVHRDLKPANIYLLSVAGATDFVKVLDFGISKVRAATTKLTQATAVMGTPNYMSPEQALGRVEEIDERTDQWALACIAWECLAGQGPFVGDSSPSILYQVVHEPPPSLASKVAGLPAEVEVVLRCALTKDKQQRFASVAAFASALEAASTGLSQAPVPEPAPSVPRTERLPDAVAGNTAQLEAKPSTTFMRTAGEVTDRSRTHRIAAGWILAIGGSAVVALSLAVFLLLRPGSGAKQEVSMPIPAAPTAPAPAPAPASVAPPEPEPLPPPPPRPAAEPTKPEEVVVPAEPPTEPPARPPGVAKRKRVKHDAAAKPAPAEPTTPASGPAKGRRRLIKEL